MKRHGPRFMRSGDFRICRHHSAYVDGTRASHSSKWREREREREGELGCPRLSRSQDQRGLWTHDRECFGNTVTETARESFEPRIGGPRNFVAAHTLAKPQRIRTCFKNRAVSARGLINACSFAEGSNCPFWGTCDMSHTRIYIYISLLPSID